MCGIVGYVGMKPAQEVILQGLRRLEYRGYDSSGLAVLNGEELQIRRSVGKLDALEEVLREYPLEGTLGVGHTRWATHGSPTEENAHPHEAGGVVVVHNGIIENYLELKKQLMDEGRRFSSETDTEVICHLIDRAISHGLGFREAVLHALGMLRGSYALGILWRGQQDCIIGARKESPLIIGLGEGENFLASDIPAILHHTRRMIFLDDGEVAILRREGVEVLDLDGKEVKKEIQVVEWNPVMAEKGGYRHFMLKEIYEQPRAIIDSFRGRIFPERAEVAFGPHGPPLKLLREAEKVVMVACGTSYHASLIGKFMVEGLAKLPVEVDLASEFRYRDPLIGPRTLMVAISQSGETADTLAAVKEGRERGAQVLAICNVVGSTLVRMADGVIYTQAGPEIGVASTKAFTTQLTVLYLLSIQMGLVRGTIQPAKARDLLEDLIRLPGQVEEALDLNDQIVEISKRFMNTREFLYLGRGINYPVALEGALKLKEISYIHAEGYPAGEMKHGPIALIDEYLPVVVLLTKDHTYEKLLGNIEEIKARKGIVIGVASQPGEDLARRVDELISIPWNNTYLTPVLFTIPLQLLAYNLAVLKGTDVDQPRNLAKSVTVE
jgi:glucosamine--fructose-6-phosphate aminotransferase (isomerizing)